MRTLTLISAIVLFSFSAKADFVDFFVIKHNNRTIPWDHDKLNTYNISVKNIKYGDTLSVEYNDDSPCEECVSIIYLIPFTGDSTKARPIIYGFGINNHKAAIDLNQFRVLMQKDSLYDLYYYEQGINAESKPRRIGRLKMWNCNDETINNAPKFHIEIGGSLIPYEKDTFPIARIRASQITEKDSLSIAYNSCTSCENCKQIAYAVSHGLKKSSAQIIVEGVGTNRIYGGGQLIRDRDWGEAPKIGLKALADAVKSEKFFDVFYYEVGKTTHNKHQLVMRIIVTP